jgi:hypothetical protein
MQQAGESIETNPEREDSEVVVDVVVTQSEAVDLRVKLTDHAGERIMAKPEPNMFVKKSEIPSVASAIGPPEMLIVKTITTTMN